MPVELPRAAFRAGSTAEPDIPDYFCETFNGKIKEAATLQRQGGDS